MSRAGLASAILLLLVVIGLFTGLSILDSRGKVYSETRSIGDGAGWGILTVPIHTYSSSLEVFPETGLTIRLGLNSSSGTLYGPLAIIVADPNITINSIALDVSPPLPLTLYTLGPIPSSGYTTYSPGNAVLNITGSPGQIVYLAWIPVSAVSSLQIYPDILLHVNLQPGSSTSIQHRLNFTLTYYLGTDALDNPWSDEPVSEYSSLINLTPTIIRVVKEEVKVSGGLGDWAEEDTVPVGPNYLYNYTIYLDIAPGYNVSEVNLTDILPQGYNVTGYWWNVYSTVSSSTFTLSNNPYTGGILRLNLVNATGVSGYDAIIMLEGHLIPDILSCNTTINIVNTAYVTAAYHDVNTNTTTIYTASSTENLTAKHMTVEKSAALVIDNNAPGPTPGDIVEYTIYLEVSDYSNLTNVIVNDTLGNGLLVDRSRDPELLLCIAGSCITATFDPGEYTYGPDHGGPNGETILVFNVTGAVQRLTGYINLSGGALLGGGATYLAIKFNATIEDTYSGPINAPVAAGDPLLNSVDARANDTLCSIGVADSSGVTIHIPTPQVFKSLAYVNGAPSTAPVDVYVLDNITYNITVIIPSGDIHNLVIEDTLPPPLLDVTQIIGQYVGPAPPPPGYWMISGNDNLTTITGVTPTISIDPASNTIRFIYGSINIIGSQPLRIELLYTVTVRDAPFDDPYQMANTARLSFSNILNTIFQHTVVNYGINARGPEVSVEKYVAIGGSLASEVSVDAWDRVDFMINITNTGGSPTYNLTFNDSINALDPSVWARNISNIIVYLSNGTVLANGTHYIMHIAPNTSYPYWMNLTLLIPLEPRQSLLVNFTVWIHEKVITGTSYYNKVEVTRYSAVANGANYVDPANPPSSTATVNLKSPLVLAKKVYWSQEDFTGKIVSGHSEPIVVGIGEVIIYEVNISIPEGVTRNLIVEDWLPALFNTSSGYWDILLVEYLNQSNVTIDDPGVTASNATLIPGTWLSITGDRVYPNIVRYYLGNVTNTNNDSDDEVVTIRLKAIVLNMPNNTAGVWPWNGAITAFHDSNWNWRCPQCDSPPYAVVVIHEPDLQTLLSSNTTVIGVGSAGIRFNLTLHNAASAYSGPAFDLWAITPLPPGIYLDTSTILVYLRNSTGLYPLSYTSYSTPSKLNISISLDRGLLPGESIHVYFNATASPGLLTGGIINVAGYFISSSLPGPHGTGNLTPGDPGTLYGERIYNTTSPILTLTVPGLDMVKTSNKNKATIGESVSYKVSILIPFGTTNNLTLVDDLGPGFSFVSLDLCVVNGVGISVDNCPPIITVTGNKVIMSFGNVTSTTPAYGYIILIYTVTVKDIPSNTAGVNLANNATIYYNSNSTSSSVTVTVVEPDLVLYKDFTPSTINNTNPLSVINITVRNLNTTFSSTAYDIIVQDIVPSTLSIVSVSHAESYAAGVTVTVNGNNITLTADYLIPGGYITLLITVTANNSTIVNSTINNTVGLIGSSLPGDVSGERVYNISAYDTLAYTAGFSIAKTVDDLAPDLYVESSEINAPPGAILEYRMNITIPLGTIPEVNISDLLDPMTSLVTSSVTIISGPGVSIGSYTIASYSPLQITFYNISSNLTYSYITLSYIVQVSNSTSSGDVIVNSVTMIIRDGYGDAYTSIDNTIVNVVEPELVVTKAFDPPVIYHTQVFSTLIINVSNTGTSPAYDIVIEDIVPSTLLVVNFTTPSIGSLTVAGNTLYYMIDRLDPGSWIAINLTVRAYAGTPWNSTTINTAEVNYTSVPGSIPGEKHYSTSASAELFYDPIVDGLKIMRPTSVWVGSIVEARINITIPTGYTSNLTLRDVWDNGLSLVDIDVQHPPNITISVPIIAQSGNMLTIQFGNVSNNDTKPLNITVIMMMRVDYVPQEGDRSDLVYWNNATIYWVDDGLLANRSLQTMAMVEIPPIIGGDAMVRMPIEGLGIVSILVGLILLTIIGWRIRRSRFGISQN
ncbi:MAG: isopeptide-forming domain-containing fimbrial protein [Desulfurococcales archaeon]|nr:isopeptide-forming domain-containing fimbrial protein [Desulfurococcales archaeon]